MPFLIDGHNLIGKLPDISLDDPNDEAQLVQKLAGFVARTRHRCVVVFDHGLPGGTSRMSSRGVKVVFASHRSNADKVIMDRVRRERNPAIWTVVSSDNRVIATAQRYGMQTMRSAQFVSLMQRPPPPPKPSVDEAEDVRLTPEEVDEWMELFRKRRA